MKRESLALIAVASICVFLTGDVLARGGGGRGGGGGGGRGGGGGGGGYSRPAPAASRSPSMSRPSPSASHRPQTGARPSTGAVNRPSTSAGARPSTGAVTRPATGTGAGARPGTGAVTRPATGAGTRPGAGDVARPGARPSQGQLNDFLDIPRPATGAGSNVRPGTGGAIAAGAAGGAAAAFLRDDGVGRASTLPATGPGDRLANRPGAETRPGQERRQDYANNRPERIENRQQYQENRTQRRDEVRNQVNENYPRLDFWSDYPNWAAWRINRPYRWATWGAIGGWFGYGATEPVSYSYGDTIYYQDDAVYQGEQQIATTEEYAEQATNLATSAPESQPQESEWLPLGVFALTQDGQASGSPPSMYVQLAVNKEGVMNGMLKNMSTDATETLEGMVDKKSQRAAWCVKGKQTPIIETGLSNLTQDNAPVLVHFNDGQTQQWLLVRLEEPTEKKQ
jgi:hypothetical protein